MISLVVCLYTKDSLIWPFISASFMRTFLRSDFLSFALLIVNLLKLLSSALFSISFTKDSTFPFIFWLLNLFPITGIIPVYQWNQEGLYPLNHILEIYFRENLPADPSALLKILWTRANAKVFVAWNNFLTNPKHYVYLIKLKQNLNKYQIRKDAFISFFWISYE